MENVVHQDERRVALAGLGQRLAALRLRSPEALSAMEQSLVRHGQLSAVIAFVDAAGQLELVDGFKRLQAARALGWGELRVVVLVLSNTQAKAAVEVLNRRDGLTELEEGWLIRSLYREDGLNQPEIGRLLSRHKSWVCRRLMLVELLDETVQADVRLGLLAARTAVVLGRLPHDNQRQVAELVIGRGLTTKQTEQLVAALLAAPDPAARQRLLDEVAAGRGLGRSRPAGPAPWPTPRPPALELLADIGQLSRVAGRLEARLLERPLSALGAEGAQAVRAGLAGLRPVLAVLQHLIGPGCEPADQSTRTASSPPERGCQEQEVQS